MLENGSTMYENVTLMLKKLKKLSYEENMKNYRAHNEANLNEIVELVDKSEDKEKTCKEIADRLVEIVISEFGKDGKLPSRTSADLDFYSIYYVFPSILLTGSENAELIVETLKDTWNSRFKKKIGYTTYEKLHDSFRNKIFGIF